MKGGWGVVYKGHHTDLDLDVAVKFLHPQRVRAAEGPERFLREARPAARAESSRIVRVFDCGESEGYYYIVMEFVDGQSLADHIQERRAVPVARALQIAEACAGAGDGVRADRGDPPGYRRRTSCSRRPVR